MRESVPTARYSPVCNVLRQWKTSLILTYRVYRLYDIYVCMDIESETYNTVFPRIDRARTIYFSALIGARTNRGRGLIEGAVYYCD